MPRPVLSVPANGAAGTQHPADLGEEAVLGFRGGHVVEHREAGGAAEDCVLERHRGAIALHDLHALAEARAERAGEERGRARAPSDAPSRAASTSVAGPKPGPTSSTSSPRSCPVQRERHELLAHVSLPGLAVAVPVVQAVHWAGAGSGSAARLLSAGWSSRRESARKGSERTMIAELAT